MSVPSARAKHLVLLGAGHAHVGVLRDFGLNPPSGVRLTLISRRKLTPYSGMLPGLIAGLYQHDEAHIDTEPLARFARADLIIDEAIGVDPTGKHVLFGDRPPLPYDVLSIDIGATPSALSVPGVRDHAIPVKPIDGFLERFEAARADILANGRHTRIGVIGAGAGGVELLLAMHRRLSRDMAAAGGDASKLHFTLIDANNTILSTFPAKLQRRFNDILRTRQITVLTGGKVTSVTRNGIEVERHDHVPLDQIFWTTEATPAPWLRDTGLAVDADGFIRVAQTLQSISHSDVFAAGDVAKIDGHPTPRSGVYAVRAAAPLAANLRRIVNDEPLITFTPQRDALYLISTGERYAIGTRNGFTFGGTWVWWLKDWIDRRFMAQYHDLSR